jgi:hypothetical protein
VLAAGCGPTLPNAGACAAVLAPGDLVITEVFADFSPSSGGSDTGKEWFEIYNARGAAIDLAGLTIRHSRPDGSRPNLHIVGRATIAPGQFFTLGDAQAGQVPPYLDYGYGSDLGELYNTGGGKLTVSCGDAEIDSAVYGDVKQGHSRELGAGQPPDYTLNDDPVQWCQGNASEFEPGNFGTPGASNDCQPIVSGQCSERGALRDVVSPGVGDLVITEVMPSPAKVADATGEWFEARVVADVDLNGVGLDRAGDTARPDVISSPDCVRVTAGSYVVFARSSDPAANGGLPSAALAGAFKFALVPGTAAPGDAAIVAGTTVIDAVRWTRSSTGKALQLDPGRIDPVANDDDSNFCDATQPYGAGDLGTPGAANSPCAALPPPGMCDDGGRIRPIARPRLGELVISEFMVHPLDATGSKEDTQREWFEVANLAAAAFDLNELGIGRIGATGATVQSARCLSVAPGDYAVFARSTDPAVSQLDSVAAAFGFGLVDSASSIQIASGSTVLDAVHWSSLAAGVSRQLDPRRLDPASNDDAGSASYCAGTAPYGDGINRGSPGAANPPCP